MPSDNNTNNENLNFEQSINELETIVTELEVGDLSLEESLSNFERGIKLSKECQTKLTDAKQKVSLLVGDEMELVDFESEEK